MEKGIFDTDEDKPTVRKVGILLGIGIFIMPYICSWFLLRKGHSKMARIIGFGWLILFFVFGAIGGGNKEVSEPEYVTREFLESKISTDAVENITPLKGHKASHAIFGDRIDEINDMQKWAAYFVAVDNECIKVTMVAIAIDDSTKDDPVFIVFCEDYKSDQLKYIVSELQVNYAEKELSKPDGVLQRQDIKTETEIFSAIDFSASDAIKICDIYAKANIKKPYTFDPHHLSTEQQRQGKIWAVNRVFSAENDFGMQLTNKYYCRVDITTKTVTNFGIQ